MGLTRARELLRFVDSALSQLNRACEDEAINHNRNVEQAIARLNDLKGRLQADIGDGAEAFNSGRAVGGRGRA